MKWHHDAFLHQTLENRSSNEKKIVNRQFYRSSLQSFDFCFPIAMEDDAGCLPCKRGTMASKSRCKTCYHREREKDPMAKSMEIKKRCANPTNGCIVCNEYVCAPCWPIHVENTKRMRFKDQDKNDNVSLRVDARPNAERSASVVMESIFATNGMNWRDFLEKKWEKNTHLFTYDAEIAPVSSLPLVVSKSSASSRSSLSIVPIPVKSLIPAIYGGDGRWRETSMAIFPLREIIRQGWHILTTCMSVNYNDISTNGRVADPMMQVWVLQKSQPKTRKEIQNLYDGDLYESYLSGCSIVWENCDLLSPHITALCRDLQGDKEDERDNKISNYNTVRAFDKAYATAHLNPPNHSEQSKVRANDDKNILVFQLAGRNYWKTYWSTPGESSSESEKAYITTTPTSTTTSKSFEGFLYPGDILYVPKGMYYETQTNCPPQSKTKNASHESESDPCMSFDVTIRLEKSKGSVARMIRRAAYNISRNLRDCSSGTNVISEDNHEKQEPDDVQTSNNSDFDNSLFRKRKLVIRETGQTLPECYPARRRKFNSIGGPALTTSKLLIIGANTKSLDFVVGPKVASKIDFQTFVRESRRSEENHCLHLLSKGSHVEIDKRREASTRPELRDVAKVIASRLRSWASLGKMTAAYIRVCSLCELIKNSFEDRVEVYLVCDLTILALVKREIESGNLAVETL